MRAVFICQAVDDDDPVVPHLSRWIDAFARHPSIETVEVLTLRSGSYTLPDNASLAVVGRHFRVATALQFIRQVRRAIRSGADFVFVCQGGPYPALLLPFRLTGRVRVYQWQAHPHVGPAIRFYARWCVDLVFTATPRSFPMEIAKRRPVGHGIDTSLFQPTGVAPDRGLVVVGRIAPVKRLEEAIAALEVLHRSTSTDVPTLEIVGPCDDDQVAYRHDLRTRIDRAGLGDAVRFLGPVRRTELARLLPRYRCSLNFSDTALDKAAAESMACGIPVITSNPRVEEALPPSLHEMLTVPARDPEKQAAAIRTVLDLTSTERDSIGQQLRSAIVDRHSIDQLFDKIIDEITDFQGTSSP